MLFALIHCGPILPAPAEGANRQSVPCHLSILREGATEAKTINKMGKFQKMMARMGGGAAGSARKRVSW